MKRILDLEVIWYLLLLANSIFDSKAIMFYKILFSDFLLQIIMVNTFFLSSLKKDHDGNKSFHKGLVQLKPEYYFQTM